MTLPIPTYDHRQYYYGSRALLMTPQELSDYVLSVMPKVRDFDTLVGTGLSGTIAIVKLASVWNKHTAFIRKTSESNHSSRIIEGSIGKAWLFVDDIISTGSTVMRCSALMTDLAPMARCVGGLLYGDTYCPPRFVERDSMHLYGAIVS